MKNVRSSWLILMTVIWTVLTVALATWWLVFSLKQIELYQSLVSNEFYQQHFSHYGRMLRLEGTFLIGLLISGGGALLWTLWRLKIQNDRVLEFFGVFSHELRTSITNLRLQTEILEEEVRPLGIDNPLAIRAVRVMQESQRVQIQLENSLWLASADSHGIFVEEIKLSEWLDWLKSLWPELKVSFEGSKDMTLTTDRRCLEAVTKNIFQNAVVHGGADRLQVIFHSTATGTVLQFIDNGKGFSGAPDELGKIFHRHSSTSGSGIGLYLVKHLTNTMGGTARFFHPEKGISGFGIELTFPKSLARSQ